MAADPAFGFKLGCECCLDLAIIMAVNLASRRGRFLRELDYVLSQVVQQIQHRCALPGAVYGCSPMYALSERLAEAQADLHAW